MAYIKDEGFNFNILTFIFSFIVSCYAFQLACPFVKSCFGHAMSKATQYAIDDGKICVVFSKVNLKEVQWVRSQSNEPQTMSDDRKIVKFFKHI
jgi:hypothetical protein